MDNTIYSNLNEKIFTEHITPIVKLFEEKNVFFWLDFGTLLGAMRDNRIIDWDHDLDFSIWEKDREKLFEIATILKQRGYNVIFQKNLPRFESMLQIVLPIKKTEGRTKQILSHIDVYVYTEIGDEACVRNINYMNTSKTSFPISYRLFRALNMLDEGYSKSLLGKLKWSATRSLLNIMPSVLKRIASNIIWEIYLNFNKTVWLVAPKVFFSDFSTTTFYGIKVNVPFQSDEYLSYIYSQNWRIPNKNFNWRYDHGGVSMRKLKSPHFSYIPIKKN